VFQSVFTNTAPADSRHSIVYDASKWRVKSNGGEQSLVLRERWGPVWQQRQVKKPQRIAFEWSLLPTQQTYQPADYNWGMTFYKLPHGTTFDLKLEWTLDGEDKTAVIKDVQCSKDIYIPPVAQ
jgi:hypothetical protein